MGKGIFVAISVLAASLALTVPAQAQATVQDHEHYSVPFSDDFELCGFSIHLEGLASGNARNRVGKGDLATAYFGLDNYEYTSRSSPPTGRGSPASTAMADRAMDRLPLTAESDATARCRATSESASALQLIRGEQRPSGVGTEPSSPRGGLRVAVVHPVG
jgi:hypothetical protein